MPQEDQKVKFFAGDVVRQLFDRDVLELLQTLCDQQHASATTTVAFLDVPIVRDEQRLIEAVGHLQALGKVICLDFGLQQLVDRVLVSGLAALLELRLQTIIVEIILQILDVGQVALDLDPPCGKGVGVLHRMLPTHFVPVAV